MLLIPQGANQIYWTTNPVTSDSDSDNQTTVNLVRLDTRRSVFFPSSFTLVGLLAYQVYVDLVHNYSNCALTFLGSN